ncbi:MAG: sugar ABC transporter substrate-binding protein [Rhodospirillales bacterium]|nr:sugar ABC transporter substrate-binding protein [Rhodospirillales bacterium]
MKRHWTVKFALLAGLAAAVLGAGATEASAQTIRMWTFLNPAGNAPREKALAEIISAFEKANPGAKVAVEPQVWDQMTPKFLAATQQGTAPDVMWVITDLLGDTIKSGSLADLNKLFVDKWPAGQKKDNAGAYWDLCSVDGRQYCMFQSRNYIGLYYRPDLFKEAGIDAAKLTTWPAFIEAAKKLTVKDANGAVTRYGFGQAWSESQPDPQIVIPYILAKQGNLFDEKGHARFATPAGIEGLTLQTEMVTKHEVTPKLVTGWTVDDLYEQFSAGRVAMITGASVRVSTLQARMGKDKVGFMLFPGVDGKPNSPGVMAGWAVGVSSKSKNIDLAGKFVEFMGGPEADKIWVGVGGQTPGLASTAGTMPAFFADPANAYLAVAGKGASTAGWLAPIAFSVDGYRQLLNKAAQDVVVNGMTPKAALERAEREFQRRNNR